jgi:hypothetical protein
METETAECVSRQWDETVPRSKMRPSIQKPVIYNYVPPTCIYSVHFTTKRSFCTFKRVLRELSDLFQYEPLNQPGNRAYMHHVIVYECQGNEEEFEAHARDRGQMCYQPPMPPLFFNCNNVVIAWGIGSEVSVTTVILVPLCKISNREFYWFSRFFDYLFLSLASM